jgi:hypothetical protein
VRNAYKDLVGRDHAEDKDVDGWTTLGRILGKEDGEEWIGFIWLRIGTGGGIL